MKLSDLIIEHGPYIGPSATVMGVDVSAADLNELREELSAARKLGELLTRFTAQGGADGAFGDIDLHCNRCGHDSWIEEEVTLAELSRRAGEHAEVCR